MVEGVTNVWVPVEDIERALDFYQNTLGFSVIKQDGPWAEVDAGGLNVGLNGREPRGRSEEHTSELQSRQYLVCRLLLDKKNRPASHQLHAPRPPNFHLFPVIQFIL